MNGNPLILKLRSWLQHTTLHVVAFLLLYVLLGVEYYRFVYLHYFQLMGFDFRFAPVPFLCGLLMVALFVVVLFVVRHGQDRMYALALIVASLFGLPSVVMYQIGGTTPFTPMYALLFCTLLLLPQLRLSQLPLPRLDGRKLWWMLPLLCLLALVPFVLAYGFRFDTSVFALDEHIYDVRSASASRANVFTNYLKGPLANVLIPALLIFGLEKRKRGIPLVLGAVALLGYLFLTSPQKSIFFSLFVVGFFYLFRSYRAKSGLFLYGILALCAGSVVLNWVTGNMMVESIVVRRLFFIPALVADHYFVFFHHHPMMLSHSFLSPFFEYPYSLDPSHLIGDMMYRRTITSCNTGIIADGYMNFGHLGACFFVLLGALVLRFLDSVPYSHRYFGLVVLLVINFLNGALFTSLLTHGGLMLMVMIMFFLPLQSTAAPTQSDLS